MPLAKSLRLPAITALGLTAPLLFSGCASGPSGGAISNASPNRLAVTMNIDKTIDSNAYYAVAFDDTTGDGQGPVAILGITPIPNGVVGGKWRVCIIWHAGQFHVYRRSTPDNYTTEVEELSSLPFIGTPRASTNSISFTLDLDAQFGSGTYFFPHTAAGNLAAAAFDVNFVTSNTVIMGGGSSSATKWIDSNGDGGSTPFEMAVDSTRTVPGSDPAGDSNSSDAELSFPGYNFGQIDVTAFNISITRKTTSPLLGG